MSAGGKIFRSIKNSYSKLDRSTGKSFFGNDAGLKHNIQGNIKKKKYSQNKNSIENSEFESNGYTYLGESDSALIKEINSKFQNMIEDEKCSEVVSEQNGTVYMKKLRNPMEDIPEIKKLFTRDLIEKIEDCVNGHFSIKDVQVWRNNHIPSEIENGQKGDLFSNLWHCDYSYTDETKLFFYLEDVTKDEGPIHMVSPSATKELIKNGYTDRYDIDFNKKLFDSKKQIFKGIGSAGTILLVNTEICLHKAGNPAKNHHRDVIQFHFKSSPKPLSNDWIDITN